MGTSDIGIAAHADESDILRFLDAHWKKGHVFTTHPALFRWQHVSRVDDDAFNYLIARDARTREITAVLGFIPMRQFDDRLTHGDLFLAIWRVRDDVRAPGLGVRLLHALIRQRAPGFVGVIGLSEMSIPLYESLGFETGQLAHHVLFNPGVGQFRIARNVSAAFVAARRVPEGVLVTMRAGLRPPAFSEAALDVLCARSRPGKSWRYVCNRYTHHPVYEYFFSFVAGEERACFFVWRRVTANGSAALRIVDLLGDESALRRCPGDLQTLMAEQDAEYLDVTHYGLDAAALAAAGFVDRRADASLIVPGYFEPFEASNVDLAFAFKRFDATDSRPVRLLRGDSDQDRPNLIDTAADADTGPQ
jgi:hypothetical protein